MKLILILFLFPISAFSSHVVHCIWEGTVESKTKDEFQVKVLKSKKLKMSYVDCQEFIGKTKKLSFKDNRINMTKDLQLKKPVKVNFLYMNSMGPKGMVENTTWFYEVKIK